jgi:beta-glucanase (GH16 family)
LLIFLSGIALLAQEYSPETNGDLVWGDEFEGTGPIDGTKWERQEYNRRNNDAGPDGWCSREDSYLDGNGNLVIRVREIPNKNNDTDSCDYSVGALRSYGKFSKLYGKYEIRCKLPTQPGWWVAFRMMQGNVGAVGNGGVDGVEVDIMEGFGWTNLINNAFHWDGYGDDHKSYGRQFRPAGIREGFHTFAMEWYPEIYIFFIDGKETFRNIGGGVCNKPGYVKVTGEISTETWAINEYWSEHPAKASYPDSFLVDYVRVYDVGSYQYPAGTGDVSEKERISLYPNPAADQLILSWDETAFPDENNITILSAEGKTVKSFGKVANNTGIPVNDLARGFIRLEQDGKQLYLKFI